MPTDWEANLRTLIKNTEKDADFLRLGSSWKVRGVRGKTQGNMRLQEGLGEKGHFKNVGTAFSGILKRYKPWISLFKKNKGVSP